MADMKFRAVGLRWSLGLSLMVCSFSASAVELPDLLDKGRGLIAEGSNEEAFQTFQAEELEYAGVPSYDYWFGVSAIRAGHASLGLLALDRLLLVQPEHAGGRLERAFALLQLGMLDEADDELDQLQQMNPPEKAAEVIKRYRSLIAEKRTQDERPSHVVVVGSGLGYDSNVNSAPSDYLLDLFGGLFQSRVSGEDSTFSDFRLQYMANVPVDAIHSVQFVFGGQSRAHHKSSLDPYNLGLIQGQAVWRYSPSADLVVNTRGELVRVYSGASYDGLFTQYGLSSSVDIPVFLESRLELGGGLRSVRYDTGEANDADEISLLSGLTVPLSSQVQVGSELTFEHEQADDRDGGSANRIKAQLDLNYKLNLKHRLQVSLSSQWVNYQDKGFGVYNDFVPVSRRDRSFQGGAEWLWAITPSLSLTTQAGYRQQTSSLEFFEYNQFSVSSNLNYLWR